MKNHKISKTLDRFNFEVETNERKYKTLQILNKVVECSQAIWISGTKKKRTLKNDISMVISCCLTCETNSNQFLKPVRSLYL